MGLRWYHKINEGMHITDDCGNDFDIVLRDIARRSDWKCEEVKIEILNNGRSTRTVSLTGLTGFVYIANNLGVGLSDRSSCRKNKACIHYRLGSGYNLMARCYPAVSI